MANKISIEPICNSFSPKSKQEKIVATIPVVANIIGINLGIARILSSYFLANNPKEKKGIPINAKLRTNIIGIEIPIIERPSPNKICKKRRIKEAANIIFSFKRMAVAI